MTVERSVDGWPGDRKNLGQIADGIVAGVVHAAQLLLLFVRQLGLLAAQLSFGSCDRHALAGAHAVIFDGTSSMPRFTAGWWPDRKSKW